MRRFGLIGDVHAEDVLLAAALERLAGEDLDAILCVGDLADGRGDLDRCIELLVRHRVLTVRGNHDRWCLAGEMRDLPRAIALDGLSDGSRRYLAELPATRRLETVAGPLMLAHGLGQEDMIHVTDHYGLVFHVDCQGPVLRPDQRLGIPADIKIHVGGHTHERWAEQIGCLTVINAATLKSTDTPCFGVLDLGDRYLQWYDLDEEARVMESERVRF